MDKTISVNGTDYQILKLLGHGKGGYSYLALSCDRQVVLKRIHHEPCDYYTFGNKIESEKNDFRRLHEAGIRIPEMISVDDAAEIIVKEYIDGPTIFDLVRDNISVDLYLIQVREMAELARKAGLNIDYFPTNFVVRNHLIYYVDYECNLYMDEWNFENWGIKYWSRTPEFEEYLQNHAQSQNPVSQ
jgi:tRNA A-37 threonylcarbamoyl transferase component Bud32